MKIVVVIPTYDERDNVRPMADAVLSNLPADGAILFVDDNSPDGTGVILDEMSAANPRIAVLHREKKEGLGRAYVAGFAKALEMGADRVIEMDCDFSHDPAMLPKLISSDADVTIGSRYVKGGSTPGWPFKRRLISRLGGFVTRAVTGMPVKDPTGGFKCFRRSALEALGDFSEVKSFGYSFQLEMNFRMWKRGLRIAEIPISFPDRKVGYSKITGGIAVESLKMVFALRYEKLLTWLRAIRVQQWTKNMLIPGAWFFAVCDPGQRSLAEGWRPMMLMLGMFASFCLVSSAFYLFNDIRDREADRLHPAKRLRPIAAGLITPRAAAIVASCLFVLGFIPSIVMLARHLDRWPMMAVMLGYSVMQVCYSGFLKRLPYVDVAVIAAGFVLRGMAGTTVLAVRLSPWLLACAFSLSLFLALCKRRHEKLISAKSRAALSGYHLPTLDLLISSTAMMTLAVYVAYTLVPATVQRYACGSWLALTAIPVAMGLIRYLQLTYSKADVGRPEKILLSDRILWLVLALYGGTVSFVLFWKF